MTQQARQFQRLKQVFRGVIINDEPLKQHTSFRIGGPAEYYLYPKDLEDLVAVLAFAQREGLPFMVIGNGSNLLVADEGVAGLVIDLSQTFNHMALKENRVTVGAGSGLGRLVTYCRERGLSGLEWACGIPARVGGALRLNAGAHGSQMGDLLTVLRVLDKDGNLECLKAEELTLSYRQIDLPVSSIIVECEMGFSDGNPKEMERVEKAYQRTRRERQPLTLPNAGSTFRNPPDDYAGRLIEEAGCKGLRIGDAMVSKKHANFLINCGMASASDVRRLIDEVRQRVYARFAVELILEIHMVGFPQT